MADLWPNDIEITTQKAPLSILQEQASILGAKTKNLVKAEVEVGSVVTIALAATKKKYATNMQTTREASTLTSVDRDDDSFTKDYSQLFVYDFYIAAPVLNYRFRIFSVVYDFRLYPVRFYLDKDIQDQIVRVQGKQIIEVLSEDELSSILIQIFSSDKVRRIINALLVQT